MDFKLHPTTIFMLSDQSVNLTDRLKLCRLMWVSADLILPNKFQAILNWLCTQIVNNKDDVSISKLCIQTMKDFITSKCLVKELQCKPCKINFRHNFAQTLIGHIKNATEAEDLKSLQKISDVLVYAEGVTISLRSQFETFAQFTSVWIVALIRIATVSGSTEDHFVLTITKFIQSLLSYGQKSFVKKYVKKTVTLGFCHHMLLPLMELHQTFTNMHPLNSNLDAEKMCKSIENAISSAIYSTSNLCSFEHLQVADGSPKKSPKPNKKDSSCFDAILACIESESGSSNNATLAARAKLLYKIFLESYPKSSALKIGMLQELVKQTCMQEAESLEGMMRDSPKNLDAMEGLLGLALHYRLYQPNVNPQQSELLFLWLKKLTEDLLNAYGSTSSWFSCMRILAQTEKGIIEPHLKQVISRLSSDENWLDTDLNESVRLLLDSIVCIYVKVRQPVNLVEILLLSVAEIVGKAVEGGVENSGMVACVEILGDCLGNQFVKGVTPGMIIDVWSAAIEKFAGCVEDAKTFETRPITLCHVLARFIAKIIQCTPLLAIWKSIMGREKMEKSYAMLVSLVTSLHDIALSSATQDIPTVTQEFIIDTFVTTLVTLMELKDGLERFALTRFKSVTPGVPAVLYRKCERNETTLPVIYTNIGLESLRSDRTKLLYLRYLLHQIHVLKLDISATELYKKLQEDGSEGMEMSESPHGRLEECSGRLDAILSIIKPDWVSACVDPDMEDQRFFVESFAAIVDHLPFIGESATVCDWLVGAVLSATQKQLCDHHTKLGEKISQLFSHIHTHPNVLFASSLLRQVFQKFTEFLTSMEITSIKLDVSEDGILAAVEKIMGKKGLKGTEIGQMMDALTMMDDIANLLQHLKLEMVSDEMLSSCVLLVLTCLQLCSQISSSAANDKIVSKAKAVLEIYTNCFVFLCADKMSHYTRWCFTDVQISLPFFAKIIPHVGLKSQHLVKVFLFDVLLVSYRDVPQVSFDNMLKRYRTPTDVMQTIIMMTVHMFALVGALSHGEMWSPGGKMGPDRKRKMRTKAQFSKKLKLDLDVEAEQPRNMMVTHLNQLLNLACSGVPTLPAENGTVFHDFLFACLESYAVLTITQPEYSAENVSGFLKWELNRIFDNLSLESDMDACRSMLQCINCCVVSKNQIFNPDKTHLKILVRCYQKLEHDARAMHLNDNSIRCIMEQMPENQFKEVFEDLLSNVEVTTGEQLKNCLRFSHVLVTMVFPGYGLTHPVMKQSCSRYVKALLDALLGVIEKVVQTFSSDKLHVLILTLTNIAEILKLKWASLQTPHVCEILSTTHAVPLSKMADCVTDKRGAEDFLLLFESFCKVVHGVITNFEDLKNIVPACNNAFWLLLQGALSLGRQTVSDAALPKRYCAIDELLKCARLLEKLFQLVADNHKQAFAKCVSYVVANFVCLFSSSAYVPLVRKSLLSAVYHLMSIMDEYCVAMVRNALPVGVRDTFQSIYVDYCKYFKYSGRV